MGRRSAVDRLPEPIKAQIDAAIFKGDRTLDELLALAQEAGARISRSTIGRYKIRADRWRAAGGGLLLVAVRHYLALSAADQERFHSVLRTGVRQDAALAPEPDAATMLRFLSSM